MTTQRIAELEAEVMRLREALHYSLGAWHYDGISDEHGSIFKEASDRCDTPFTPTALNELIEKVEKLTIERCASFVDDSCTYGDTHILVKAVRTLPTGQIKLEELL